MNPGSTLLLCAVGFLLFMLHVAGMGVIYTNDKEKKTRQIGTAAWCFLALSMAFVVMALILTGKHSSTRSQAILGPTSPNVLPLNAQTLQILITWFISIIWYLIFIVLSAIYVDDQNNKSAEVVAANIGVYGSVLLTLYLAYKMGDAVK